MWSLLSRNNSAGLLRTCCGWHWGAIAAAILLGGVHVQECSMQMLLLCAPAAALHGHVQLNKTVAM